MSADDTIGFTEDGSSSSAHPSPGRTVPLSDHGNAQRLIERHGDDLRYCAGLGWLIWDGGRWKPDQTGQVMERAKETIRSCLRAAPPEVIEIYSFWLRSESAPRLRAMVQLAESDPRIAVLPSQLDASPFLFNCKNGTIDLWTGALRPHAREDLITKIANVDYNPEAAAPRWMRFLDEITQHDAALESYLQRVCGYCLTGDISEQVAFLCYGLGANGKSVLLNTLLALMGDYAGPAAPNLLLSQRNEPHPTGLADLQGRRVAVANEVEQGRTLNESLLKLITGGDKLKARRMRQDYIEFPPTAKFFLAANHLPEVAGADYGIWRRLHVIPFKQRFEGERCDSRLEETLRGELSGILAWAVRGCLEWSRKRLSPPPAVTEAAEEYRRDSDALMNFLAACTCDDKNAQVSGKDLYNRYIKWCEEGNEPQISKKAFGINLKSRGYERKLVHGYAVYCGLRLHAPWGGDGWAFSSLSTDDGADQRITGKQSPMPTQG